MDTLTIILIATCAVLCCAVAWLYFKRPASTEYEAGTEDDMQPQLDEKDKIISELKAERREFESKAEAHIAKLKEANSKELKEYESKAADCIAKLKEANSKELKESAERIAKLETELAQAIENGTDEGIRKKLAEIDKLLKKIKNLEEDLEEAEDEADDLKKRNKKLLTEKSTLQEELEEEIRKGKKLLAEIDEVKVRLQSVQKDFELRGESLDFVTEILTAEHSSDQSVRNLYQTVDSIVDYIKNEVKDTLTSIYDFNDESKKALFGSDVDAWAVSRKKTWIQGKTSIAFVGEFSAGKTSIVNRILSQDNPNVPLLPVNSKATTAIPTYISGGVSTFFQFVTPDNELKGISERTFKRVNKEVLDQVKGVSSLIQYFVMTYKNPHLERLSILDTPGFSSNDTEDAERTIGVINECDALFWVFDVNAGTVNRESIKTIKKNLSKPLYVVINQIDTKSKSDVDAVENLIRRTLQNEGIKIEGIVRFSKKEPLRNIMSPILAIKHNNEREQYLNVLLSHMTEMEKELSNDVKNAHKESNNLENKYQQLNGSFEQVVNNLATDCVTVSEIPQYNSRFWSADDYRISQEQYSEFVTLLENIHGPRLDRIIDCYNEQIQTVSDLQQAWDNHSQAKDYYRRVSDCLKTLQTKAKQLDSLSQTKYSQSYKAHNAQTKTQSKAAPYSTYSTYSTSNQTNQNKCLWRTEDLLKIVYEFTTSQNSDQAMIAWEKLLNRLKSITKKDLSGNQMKKYFSRWGVSGYVSRNELTQALVKVINDNL